MIVFTGTASSPTIKPDQPRWSTIADFARRVLGSRSMRESGSNPAIDWSEFPSFSKHEFHSKRSTYSIVIPILNEGQRILAQLERLRELPDTPDIVLVDGSSTDGSTEPQRLSQLGVRTLLTTERRGLGNALRLGLAHVLSDGYRGAVTIDGNGKDGVEAIPFVVEQLETGYDLVQASRFLAEGFHANTPRDRTLGIKLVICPLLRISSGYSYTDPTNGFKGLSRELLLHHRIQPLRKIFSGFNFQFHLNYAAPRAGLRVREIPASRVYPVDEPTPTQIHGLRPRITLCRELLTTVLGRYDVPTA